MENKGIGLRYFSIFYMKEEEAHLHLSQLLVGFQDIQSKLRNLPVACKAIMLVGQNKVGKTALFHYLQGKKLIHQKNEMGVYVLLPDDPNDSAKVGSDYAFTTLIPNFSIKLAENTICIDMPGYSNNQSKNQLLKIYAFYKTIEHVEESHICQLFSEEQFQPYHLLKQIQNLCTFFKPEVIFSEGFLSFVVTKVENQNAIEVLESMVEELKQESQTKQLQPQLQAILLKKKYIFKNQQPIPENGIQLCKAIQDENKFFTVSRQPTSLLSDDFCKVVIGESPIQEFLTYLEIIIPQLLDVIKNVIVLSTRSIFYEYVSMVSYLQEVQEQQLKKALTKEIEEIKQAIKPRKIQIPFQKQEETVIDKYHYERMQSTFSRQEITSNNCITTFLNKLSRIFDLPAQSQNYSWARLSQEWVTFLGERIGEINSLLFTLSLIHIDQVSRTLAEIELNLACADQIDRFFVLWQANREKLKNHSQYLKAIGGSSSPTVTYTIKRPYYKQIKNGKISESVRKTKLLNANISFQYSTILKGYEITERSIKALKNDSSSFTFLMEKLNLIDQICLVRACISKIATIFYRFSLYEEAIVFSMALNDYQKIQSLVEEGFVYKQISSEFVLEILLIYYCYFGRGERRKRQLQRCSNYLSSLAQDLKQFVRFEKECLRQIPVLKSNIASSLQTHEQYQKVQFHYIHPILSLMDYYSQLLKAKEAIFHKCLCHVLLKDPSIQSLFS